MPAAAGIEHIMASENFVIVGGGLAGATAAKTLRAEGHGGPVILLAEERHHPYLRPPLSKEYLLAKAGDDALPVVPAGWYAENGVDLRLGATVTGIDPAARSVTLRDGQRLGYASLLLATGARPRRIPLPGSDLEGVSTFRTVDDSRRLRAGLAGGGRNVVMIGSGWIGMELAAAASAYGNSVTLLGLEEVPLAAAIGPELGGFFRSLHEANGVRFRLPASAAGITGQSGRVTGVVTDAGEVLPADLVIIAVGVVPEVSLAEAAGIALQNGILTDASLRTSAPRNLCRRGRRQRPASLHRRAPPQRALVQCPQRRQGGGQGDARPGRRTGHGPLLLHRPVRRQHGVLRLPGTRRRPAHDPRFARGQGVPRLLAARRPGGRGHERELAAVRQAAKDHQATHLAREPP